MQLWLPGYEHDPEHGAGLSVGPGAPKVVIHTTESGPGSWRTVRNMWRGSTNWGRGLPHFLAEGDRYVQLLPLNVGAYTARNVAGGADINRSGPAIQVEIVGYARNAFTDLEYSALGRWLADLVKAGVPLDLAQHPTFHGEGAGWVLATASARQRMTAGAYDRFAGFCGHQHLPENDHWDPGSLDANRVERIARAHLEGAPTPPPEEEDDVPVETWIMISKKGSKWFEAHGGQPGHQAMFKALNTDQFLRPMAPDEVDGHNRVHAWVTGSGGKSGLRVLGEVDDWMLSDRTLLPREWPEPDAPAPTVVSLTPEQLDAMVTKLIEALDIDPAELAAFTADELADRLDA